MSPKAISKASALPTRRPSTKNKQHRSDCRQIAAGTAFDEYGFPLAHETFEGNMADTKTLPLILDRLTHLEDGLKPVVILDGGFASRANLALLKERGYSYIVNNTRGSRRLVTTRLPLADARIINIRKSSQPDDEQKHVYQMLAIDWESAFTTQKTEIPA